MNKNDFIKKAVAGIHKERGGIICGIAFVFILWLVMYPEFSITGDCCRIVDENGQVVTLDMTERELAVAVLEAEDDEIVIKSQIWEMITEWREENDTGESKN